MSEPESTSMGTAGRQTKVARLIDEYDLAGLGAVLEARWTAEKDRSSLRDLAAYFNRHLLETRMDEAGIQTLNGEVQNTYRLLSEDEVSEADRMRARRQLERNGFDVDTLETDFVTYQAIRTYLKDERGAVYRPDETDPLEREATNVQQLRGRIDSVTEGKIEQLRDSGQSALEDFRTLVDVRIICENCNTQYSVVELLEAGGCTCQIDGE